MSRLKAMLLAAYYGGTLPVRAARARALARADRMPVVVLAWHRIADDAATSWTCSFAHFERQIAWLAPRFDLVSLAEAQRRVREGNRRPTVAITFDDGYAENLERALPLLLREKLPFTYFVTTRNVTLGVPFDHDVAAGHRFPVNSIAELRDLARAGADIGAHTRTHADLGIVEEEGVLRDEIVDAGRELAGAVGAPVRWFAFAFGLHRHMSAAGFRVAREGGYDGVCSAYGGYNFPGDDPFHLQRIPVTDDLVRLRNHATIDPFRAAPPRFVA
jgi:peptidoglycan/xylan/chitin deacetylase (PgdA/CDA1 family)